MTDTLSKMINFYGSRINLNLTPPNILLSTIHKMAVFTFIPQREPINHLVVALNTLFTVGRLADYTTSPKGSLKIEQIEKMVEPDLSFHYLWPGAPKECLAL